MTDIPIGQAVRNVRLNRGLTQQQVATRMGCPRTYVCKMEAGVFRPLVDQFIRLADAMQIESWVMLRYAERISKAGPQPPVPPITPTRAPEANGG